MRRSGRRIARQGSGQVKEQIRLRTLPEPSQEAIMARAIRLLKNSIYEEQRNMV
jgi:hypothetical protein